jgi:hypothetical protein
MMEAPQNPAGAYQPEENYAEARRAELIGQVEQAPRLLHQAVAGLSEAQLDTPYRNWTVRQIVHHVPDSHVNSYIRFKWALTEETPTIKAYDEGQWAALQDTRLGDITPPLALLEGLHARWVRLMRSMSPQQWARSFLHPQSGKLVSLSAALSQYAWHGRHHTGQILWLRQTRGWA